MAGLLGLIELAGVDESEEDVGRVDNLVWSFVSEAMGIERRRSRSGGACFTFCLLVLGQTTALVFLAAAAEGIIPALLHGYGEVWRLGKRRR
jgi:hypothetical protein